MSAALTVPVAGWMLFAVLVSGVILLAALAANEAQRAAHRSARGIWMAAIALMVALTVAVPFRERPVASSDATGPRSVDPTALLSGEAAPYHLMLRWRDAISRQSRLVVQRVSTLAESVPPVANAALAVVWVAASCSMSLAILLSYRRMQRRVRRLPPQEIAGVVVRIAPDLGPAVIGIVRPEIVIPRWLLSRPEHEQGMAVAHEAEHVRAADPWVLVAASAALALTPWNPVLWYALSRLRLAMEIDCDRRVLRHGVPCAGYGTLLIDLSAIRRPLPAIAPAFPGAASHLERRLLAMTERSVRFSSARRVVGAVVAAILAVTACESRLPTSAEVESMDVASAERQASTLGVLDSLRARFIVDGVGVDPATARALPAKRIASVEVVKGQPGMVDEVRIATRVPPGADSLAPAFQEEVKARLLRKEAQPSRTFDGLLIIDGVITNASELSKLSPDRIARIEVLKGVAATQYYSDPRAARGVIRVTMKP